MDFSHDLLWAAAANVDILSLHGANLTTTNILLRVFTSTSILSVVYTVG